MEYKRVSDHIIMRLHPGEKVHDMLIKVVRKENIRGAAVIAGVGMLTDFTLSFFKGDGYSSGSYDTPHELVSLQGTIAFAEAGGPREGEPVIHLHAALSGPDHKMVGGHLDKGTVEVLNEIVLLCPEALTLSRRQNPKTGLLELNLA